MATVVDTNVWLTAAGQNPEAGPECAELCDGWLGEFRHRGTLAVDLHFRILHEYYARLPAQSAACRILNQMQQVEGRVEFRPCDWDADGFAIVPECLSTLDPSDRKFAAVALTYRPPAPIVNAADSDWQQCAEGLQQVSIVVVELCPELTRKGK